MVCKIMSKAALRSRRMRMVRSPVDAAIGRSLVIFMRGNLCAVLGAEARLELLTGYCW